MRSDFLTESHGQEAPASAVSGGCSLRLAVFKSPSPAAASLHPGDAASM